MVVVVVGTYLLCAWGAKPDGLFWSRHKDKTIQSIYINPQSLGSEPGDYTRLVPALHSDYLVPGATPLSRYEHLRAYLSCLIGFLYVKSLIMPTSAVATCGEIAWHWQLRVAPWHSLTNSLVSLDTWTPQACDADYVFLSVTCKNTLLWKEPTWWRLHCPGLCFTMELWPASYWRAELALHMFIVAEGPPSLQTIGVLCPTDS